MRRPIGWVSDWLPIDFTLNPGIPLMTAAEILDALPARIAESAGLTEADQAIPDTAKSLAQAAELAVQGLEPWLATMPEGQMMTVPGGIIHEEKSRVFEVRVERLTDPAKDVKSFRFA